MRRYALPLRARMKISDGVVGYWNSERGLARRAEMRGRPFTRKRYLLPPMTREQRALYRKLRRALDRATALVAVLTK